MSWPFCSMTALLTSFRWRSLEAQLGRRQKQKGLLSDKLLVLIFRFYDNSWFSINQMFDEVNTAIWVIESKSSRWWGWRDIEDGNRAIVDDPADAPRTKFCGLLPGFGAKFLTGHVITKTREMSPKANLIAIVIKVHYFLPPQVLHLICIIRIFQVNSYLGQFHLIAGVYLDSIGRRWSIDKASSFSTPNSFETTDKV